jgi:hypothetical protein
LPSAQVGADPDVQAVSGEATHPATFPFCAQMGLTPEHDVATRYGTLESVLHDKTWSDDVHVEAELASHCVAGAATHAAYWPFSTQMGFGAVHGDATGFRPND